MCVKRFESKVHLLLSVRKVCLPDCSRRPSELLCARRLHQQTRCILHSVSATGRLPSVARLVEGDWTLWKDKNEVSGSGHQQQDENHDKNKYIRVIYMYVYMYIRTHSCVNI